MLRIFTGISIPQEIKKALHEMQGGIENARWTDINDYHLTLSFIGEVHEDQAELIDEALTEIKFPAFELCLNGMSCFTRGEHATFLWAGLEHSAELHDLQQKINSSLERCHIEFEKHKYTPHITLAKLKGPSEEQTAGFIAEHNLFKSAPFKVENFILYQSHQAKHNHFYSEKVLYPLL